jgi:hypothetical protein
MLVIMNLALTHLALGLAYVLVVHSTSNPEMIHVVFVMLHILFHEAVKRLSIMRGTTADIQNRVGAGFTTPYYNLEAGREVWISYI